MKKISEEYYVKKLHEGKVYCFDIDGVIFENNFPDYDKAKPIQKNIDIINKLYKDNSIIILNTARGFISGIDWYVKTIKQLNNHNVLFHRVYFQKPAANYYIDDHNANINEL